MHLERLQKQLRATSSCTDKVWMYVYGHHLRDDSVGDDSVLCRAVGEMAGLAAFPACITRLSKEQLGPS